MPPYKIPTLQQWMSDTSATFKPRSMQLKAIDQAIAEYNNATVAKEAKIFTIRRAFEAWKRVKGPGWADSSRNAKGAMANLDDFLNPGRAVSGRELGALEEIRKSQRENFKRTFVGATFQRRTETWAKDFEHAGTVAEVVDSVHADLAGLKSYEQFKEGFDKGASPGRFVMETLTKMTGLEAEAVIEAIGGSTLLGFYTAAVPFLGAFKSMGQGVVSLVKSLSDATASVRTSGAVRVVNPGAPQQALLAVSELLNRRATDKLATGAVKLAEGSINAALQATGVAAAASVGVSIAAKLGTLAVIVRRRVLEYKEKNAGQEQLMQPDKLTVAIFNVCPLLGCYLLAQSTHSDIVASCLSQGYIPARDWKFEVERSMNTLRPCIDRAKEFINDYLWELRGPGIPQAAGQKARAEAVDARPWVERFWIRKFGAKTKGYRIIKKAQKLKTKLARAKDYALDPVPTLLKKDVELFLDGIK